MSDACHHHHMVTFGHPSSNKCTMKMKLTFNSLAMPISAHGRWCNIQFHVWVLGMGDDQFHGKMKNRSHVPYYVERVVVLLVRELKTRETWYFSNFVWNDLNFPFIHVRGALEKWFVGCFSRFSPLLKSPHYTQGVREVFGKNEIIFWSHLFYPAQSFNDLLCHK